jgi:hypothetical protein
MRGVLDRPVRERSAVPSAAHRVAGVMMGIAVTTLVKMETHICSFSNTLRYILIVSRFKACANEDNAIGFRRLSPMPERA